MTPTELDKVGHAAHEAWKVWIVEGGYANHRFVSCSVDHFSEEVKLKYPDRMACGHPLGATACHWNRCLIPPEKHHPDMVPWEELPTKKRGKYLATGMAGYEVAAATYDEVHEDRMEKEAEL